MRIISGINQPYKKLNGTVASVGIFDGVHKAHRLILRKLVRQARRMKLKSVVITFYPHPAWILNKKKDVPLLISLRHRLKLIESMGVDEAVVLNFNRYFSSITAEDFIKKFLVRKFNVKILLVGKDFVFGKDAKGNIRQLRDMSKRYKFKIMVIKDIKDCNKKISSTRIRGLIEKGYLTKAADLLNRPVGVLGTVVKGNRRGRILGYPTANINPHHEAIPPSGAYAVLIKLNNKIYKGILNIGYRPTFEKGKMSRQKRDPTIEVHIFHFKKDIYGCDIEIIFVRRLRKEIRFKTKEGLVGQIKNDEQRAIRILHSCNSIDETVLIKYNQPVKYTSPS